MWVFILLMIIYGVDIIISLTYGGVQLGLHDLNLNIIVIIYIGFALNISSSTSW